MLPHEFETKWTEELERFSKRESFVRASVLCEEILTDFRSVVARGVDSILTLQQAAQESGYSVDHLSRLVRTGKLPDRRPPGSHGRIVLRRSDLPHKPNARHPRDADVHDLASRLYGGKEGRHGHP